MKYPRIGLDHWTGPLDWTIAIGQRTEVKIKSSAK